MVYYFESKGSSGSVDPPVSIYMGKHKEENLIKWGHDNDVCSAHVYVRLPDSWTWEEIPQEILIDCAQLTKANSIQGNKQDNVTIIYTPWKNLHKTKGMEAGQVGFKKENQVKKIHVECRVNAIINRLNKTKQERFPDLQQERIQHDKENKRLENVRRQQRAKKELEIARERKRLAYEKEHAYEEMFSEENVRHSSNQNRSDDWEDDFM